LMAMLEPPALRKAEREGDLTTRLALMEELKSMPWGAVWDAYCSPETCHREMNGCKRFAIMSAKFWPSADYLLLSLNHPRTTHKPIIHVQRSY
jgi:hypothetical protein